MYSSISKITKLVFGGNRSFGLSIIVFSLFVSVIETIGVVSIMPFLAVLGDPSIIFENTILLEIYELLGHIGVQGKYSFLVFLGSISFLFLLITSIIKVCNHFLVQTFIEKVRLKLSTNLFNNYLSKEYDFFLDNNSNEIAKNILSEVDQLITNVVRPFINMIVGIFLFITIVIALMIVNPTISILSSSIFFIFYILIFMICRFWLNKLGVVRTDSNSSRFKITGEALQGIKYTKIANKEKYYVDNFKSASRKYCFSQSLYQTLQHTPKYIVEAVVFGSIIALILWLMLSGGDAGGGHLGSILPLIALYTLSAYKLQPAINFVYSGFASIRFGKSSVDNIYTHLSKMSNSLIVPVKSFSIRQDSYIEFNNVSFKYKNSKKNILNKVNLHLPFGLCYGIIGTTGSGKTTFVDILLGLLLPSSGFLKVNDQNLSRTNINDWQSLLSYVPQDIVLSDCTVYENIAYGIDKECIDKSLVLECAKLANIHKFVTTELPNGYNTEVGDKGTRLSGGQRQRLGIARALYTKPLLLVLDESTSALDSVTERKIMDSLKQISNKTTLFIIAHKLSTLELCDRLYEFSNGTINQVNNS